MKKCFPSACLFALLGLLAFSAGPARADAAADAEAQAGEPAAGEGDQAVLGDRDRTVFVSRSLAPRLQEAIKDILNDPALEGARLGFMVWDVDEDKQLAAYGQDALLNPASNIKMLTSSAALKILRPDFRWKTEYYAAGPIKDGVLYGDLVVKGYGDPSVVTERLQNVADELYLQGLRHITGKVIVDDSYFAGKSEARGWEMEEAPDRAYAAPVSGLSLNYNAIGVHIRPAHYRSRPAVVTADPPVEYAKVESRARTGRWTRWLRVGTEADRSHTRIVVSGIVGSRARGQKIYRRVYDPPRYFGSTLVHFLNARGVKVKHRVWHGTLPDDARLLWVDHSPRLTKVVNDLNHYSNNFIAETVVKTLAAEQTGQPGTFEVGLQIVRDFLEDEIGFKENAYTYGNGSGLNDVNRVSARQLTQLLDRMHHDWEVGPEFTASLAVAGTQGTIRSRMGEGPAERRLRAKTGTLTGVSALSGYVVDPRNKVMAFSVVVMGWNSRRVRTSDIWEIQNRLGEALASDGETWAPQMIEEPAAAEEVAQLQPSADPNEAMVEPSKGGAP